MNTCFYCGKSADGGLCPDWKVEYRQAIRNAKKPQPKPENFNHINDKRQF